MEADWQEKIKLLAATLMLLTTAQHRHLGDCMVIMEDHSNTFNVYYSAPTDNFGQ
jgi:hypothetical protein